jgi:hypothetical protein
MIVGNRPVSLLPKTEVPSGFLTKDDITRDTVWNFVHGAPALRKEIQGQIRACFPAAAQVLQKAAIAQAEESRAEYNAEQSRQLEKKQREQEARRSAEEQQKSREAEARKPENVLTSAYMSYIVVKRCYDVRQGYLAIYISDPEMTQAREAIHLIEKEIAPHLNSGVNVETLWSDADKRVQNQYGAMLSQMSAMAPHYGRGLCQRELFSLFQIRTGLFPSSGGTKKDF